MTLVVADNGIGIAADKHGRIFEPFQRVGQEAGPIEGTGIGLAIAKRLAEMMGGTVGFKSEIDRGSEFWVQLPVEQGSAPGVAALPVNERLSSRTVGSPDSKIVYVEDNPSNIALMSDLIKELSNVTLLTAPNAELGLELIRAHRPDLVIMDVNLPGMSGLEAVQRLRQWPETRELPVVGLSAAALMHDARRAKDAGFDRYLTKPVSIDGLTAVLQELLRK
jgi:CheY-like chemotaxis protein